MALTPVRRGWFVDDALMRLTGFLDPKECSLVTPEQVRISLVRVSATITAVGLS